MADNTNAKVYHRGSEVEHIVKFSILTEKKMQLGKFWYKICHSYIHVGPVLCDNYWQGSVLILIRWYFQDNGNYVYGIVDKQLLSLCDMDRGYVYIYN